MNHIQRLRLRYEPREARAIYHLVVETLFGLSMTDVLLGKDTEISANDRIILENSISRIVEGEPVQYVLGEAWFRGRRFSVSPDVLIPRPETEKLVEQVLLSHPSPARMLDIGTGSGCIAISLALEGHQVWGMDVSLKALETAQGNATHLGAEVNWMHADILSPPAYMLKWDAIVSNPPYICEHEKQEMESHVLDHEPHAALFVPDDDPLLFYRAIARFALTHLAGEGTLHFETHTRHAHDTGKMMREMGYSEVRITNDIFQRPRFVEGRI